MTNEQEAKILTNVHNSMLARTYQRVAKWMPNTVHYYKKNKFYSLKNVNIFDIYYNDKKPVPSRHTMSDRLRYAKYFKDIVGDIIWFTDEGNVILEGTSSEPVGPECITLRTIYVKDTLEFKNRKQ